MNDNIMKLISHMCNRKALWLFILSIATAVIALWARGSGFGLDDGPRATYFLCFCVSFSAYQIVSAISKNTEAQPGKQSAKNNSTILTTEPTAKFCAHCGKPLLDGAKFCVHCGKEQELNKP